LAYLQVAGIIPEDTGIVKVIDADRICSEV